MATEVGDGITQFVEHAIVLRHDCRGRLSRLTVSYGTRKHVFELVECTFFVNVGEFGRAHLAHLKTQ